MLLNQTNTSHNLSQFVVRDELGSYDNEYNQALLEYERTAAIRAATSRLTHEAVSFATVNAKRLGRAVFDGLCEYVESAQA